MDRALLVALDGAKRNHRSHHAALLLTSSARLHADHGRQWLRLIGGDLALELGGFQSSDFPTLFHSRRRMLEDQNQEGHRRYPRALHAGTELPAGWRFAYLTVRWGAPTLAGIGVLGASGAAWAAFALGHPC